MILLRIDRAADTAEVSLDSLAGTNPAPCLQRHKTHDLVTHSLTQPTCLSNFTYPDLIVISEDSVCIILWPNQVRFGLTLIQTSVTQKQVFDNVKKY